MNYNKTIWNNGDIITAEKLNNIEEGIDNVKILIVNISQTGPSDWEKDKTFTEIKEAYENGYIIFAKNYGFYLLQNINSDQILFSQTALTNFSEGTSNGYIQFKSKFITIYPDDRIVVLSTNDLKAYCSNVVR